VLEVRHPTFSEDSLLLQMAMGLLFPFMMLFGFFLILNGHYTPGGGFQGGSVFATLFIARYVVYSVDDIDSEKLHLIQKIFLGLIILAPLILLFSGVLEQFPQYKSVYLTFMDILIGVQVGFNLGVAVLRFAFFTGVGKKWHL